MYRAWPLPSRRWPGPAAGYKLACGARVGLARTVTTILIHVPWHLAPCSAVRVDLRAYESGPCRQWARHIKRMPAAGRYACTGACPELMCMPGQQHAHGPLSGLPLSAFGWAGSQVLEALLAAVQFRAHCLREGCPWSCFPMRHHELARNLPRVPLLGPVYDRPQNWRDGLQ
jgi:hypothetical protein